MPGAGGWAGLGTAHLVLLFWKVLLRSQYCSLLFIISFPSCTGRASAWKNICKHLLPMVNSSKLKTVIFSSVSSHQGGILLPLVGYTSFTPIKGVSFKIDPLKKKGLGIAFPRSMRPLRSLVTQLPVLSPAGSMHTVNTHHTILFSVPFSSSPSHTFLPSLCSRNIEKAQSCISHHPDLPQILTDFNQALILMRGDKKAEEPVPSLFFRVRVSKWRSFSFCPGAFSDLDAGRSTYLLCPSSPSAVSLGVCWQGQTEQVRG